VEVNGMARFILCALILLIPASSRALERIQAGDVAPPFFLKDLYGRTISLDYFDGHPALLAFWSASSPLSTELLKDVRVYQEKWGRSELAIVAVNADNVTPGSAAARAIRDYAEHLDLVFPVLLDSSGALRSAFGVRELPTSVVIDAGGRVSSVLGGYLPSLRAELRKDLLVAMGRGTEGGGAPAVARGAGKERPVSPAAKAFAAVCGIPRARSCAQVNDHDPSIADPTVLAMRLCVCQGDADAAQVMLTGVSERGLLSNDLRFALAHLLLIKGRTQEARRAFENLRDGHPQESWGEWGLGIVALTEGDAAESLAHFKAALAVGWSIPEAETAVLKYLEHFWRTNLPAPREEQFLALFEDLGPVRECYRRFNRRG
jgi:peroxiredoxin